MQIKVWIILGFVVSLALGIQDTVYLIMLHQSTKETRELRTAIQRCSDLQTKILKKHSNWIDIQNILCLTQNKPSRFFRKLEGGSRRMGELLELVPEYFQLAVIGSFLGAVSYRSIADQIIKVQLQLRILEHSYEHFTGNINDYNHLKAWDRYLTMQVGANAKLHRILGFKNTNPPFDYLECRLNRVPWESLAEVAFWRIVRYYWHMFGSECPFKRKEFSCCLSMWPMSVRLAGGRIEGYPHEFPKTKNALLKELHRKEVSINQLSERSLLLAEILGLLVIHKIVLGIYDLNQDNFILVRLCDQIHGLIEFKMSNYRLS